MHLPAFELGAGAFALAAKVAFLGLLAAAAACDAWRFRIPNAIPVLLALAFPASLLAGPLPTDWHFHVLGAVLVLLVGTLLFMRDMIGGGDVKLLAAASLWYGIDRLPAYLFAVALAGGALAIVVVVARFAASLRPVPDSNFVQRIRFRRQGLPYGVAIAAGGFLVAPLIGG